ncbi:MAG TPA: DUF3267 domain-containing protein [Bacillales bacterium]
MNCWKSVRFLRDYGTIRVAIFSISAMMVFFTLFYVGFLDLHPHVQISRIGLPFFLAALILVYPLHKLFHCLPLWFSGHKASLSLERNSNGVPVLFCDLPKPVSRNLAIIYVAFPVTAITIVALAAASAAPNFFHYIAVAASINFGFSIMDCIYLSFLIKAPSYAYVEDFRDGFHILIQRFKQ